MTREPADDGVIGEAVREAMRRVPTPVTVVVTGGESAQGITIGSFVTVSLDPPLLSFNVQRSARMHDVLTRVDRFALHVLGTGQEEVSEVFADPELSGAEQLARVSHVLDHHGIPALDGVVSRMECLPVAHHAAGDHSIFVARIEGIDVGEERPALLYHNRGYHALGDRDTGTHRTTNRGSSGSSQAPGPNSAKS